MSDNFIQSIFVVPNGPLSRGLSPGPCDGACPESWKIMIVSSRERIHKITRRALADFFFERAPIALLHAHSAVEAKKLIRDHPDTAVVFLDPAEKNDRSPLEIIHYVRDELKNSMVRLVIRDDRPEEELDLGFLQDYQVHVFPKKSEPESPAFFNVLISSLHGFKEKKTLARLADLENQVRRMNLELEETIKDAQKADLAKRDFLTALSQEVRTPINTILGLADLTLRNDLGAEQRENLQTIRNSARHLLQLSNDIGDLSQIESGRVKLNRIDFDLQTILNSVGQAFAPQAERKGLSLNIEPLMETPFYLKGDPGRLRQILGNLVSHAIGYTEQGGLDITVKSEAFTAPSADKPDGGGRERIRLIFSVSDTGPDISPIDQGRIFDGFNQLYSSTSGRYHRIGLGLAISKKLVETMGGEIRLVSRPGQGNVFYFSAIVEPGSPEDIREQTHEKMPKLFTGSQSLNILLVEDNPINAKVATSFLNKLGHSWVIAHTPREAVDRYTRDSFDLVLMDIEMPENDGLEAVRNLRKMQEKDKSNTPIIAMTTQALDETRNECIEAGLSDYMTKPMDFYDLDSMILRLVPECDGYMPEPSEHKHAPLERDAGLDRKSALLRLGGEESLLNELTQLFIEEIPGRIEKFGLAFETETLSDIQIQAHNLKGVATLVGAAQLSRLTLMLEQAAKTNDFSGAKEVFSRLEPELHRVKSILGR